MVPRTEHHFQIIRSLERSRIVTIAGPRQCGKTTLARELLPPAAPGYFDLEDPLSLARIDEPMTALSPLTGLVVIDEVQRKPDLFPILRVLADRPNLPARFLLLGSASPRLIRDASESLAGRLETIELTGFRLREVGMASLNRLWLLGGFPLSFLSQSDEDSFAWRQNFQQTIIERDISLLGFDLPAQSLLRFWKMLAHYHGNVWNASEIGRSIGSTAPTAQRYLDIFTGLYMIRQLQPWQENLKKRQVKSPKVFVRDSGLLHALLGIRTEADLLTHPRLGASWEGFAVEEAISAARPDEVYFWATHQGAELDLLLFKGGRRYGVEIKRRDAPRITPSIRTALSDLRLEKLTVIYPGEVVYSLSERVTVAPLQAVAMGEFPLC